MSSWSRTRAAAGRRMPSDMLRPRLVPHCPASSAVMTATPVSRRMNWGPLRPLSVGNSNAATARRLTALAARSAAAQQSRGTMVRRPRAALENMVKRQVSDGL